MTVSYQRVKPNPNQNHRYSYMSLDYISSISDEYKAAIAAYTGPIGYRINRTLRARGYKALIPEDKQVVDRLDQIFNEIPPLLMPLTVWRDMDIELHNHTQAGFVSTSTKSDQLDNEGVSPVVCCQYEIRIPPGAKIIPAKMWSVNPSEEEIILQRDSVFRYVKREIKRGAIWIYLELLLPHQRQDTIDKINSVDKHISDITAYIINKLNSGDMERQLQEENELFETETSLDEYVRQIAMHMSDNSYIADKVIMLVREANYKY